MEDGLNPATAAELRYVLDVMEENSHLGLDEEAAIRLRRILIRRINAAEGRLSGRPIATPSVVMEEAEASA